MKAEEENRMTQIEIGRLLRASTAGFVVGSRVSQLERPASGRWCASRRRTATRSTA